MRDLFTPDVVTDGAGCHEGAEMAEAARKAGSSEILDQYAKDYPQGPHDKPQSMCPAFGSLRVGLRMKRVATILSGSACCVYGLSFVSHFYGARRSVDNLDDGREIARAGSDREVRVHTPQLLERRRIVREAPADDEQGVALLGQVGIGRVDHGRSLRS